MTWPAATSFAPLVRLRMIGLGALACLGTSMARADDPAPFAPAKESRPANARRDALVDVVDRVKSSVVNIHSERTAASEDPFRVSPMQMQRVNGMGTGIVLDPRGYLITNHHVVDDVQSLRVRLVDGTSVPAKVLATDKHADLALLKIEVPRQLPMVPLGTASDLFLAEQVIAIGNAYGYEHTVTVGFVSAKNRDVTLNKEVSYQQLIQTQTPINPGNSGGPLFNKKGELVGVNVAIHAKAQNIAFAIPVDAMIARASELLASRRKNGVRHGLVVQDHAQRTTEDGPVRRWLSVIAVEADSPAAKAGVKVGDRIDKADELTVNTSIDLERVLVEKAASNRLALTLDRGGKTETVSLELTASVPTLTFAPNDIVGRRIGIKAVAVGPKVVAGVDPQLRGGLFLNEVAPNSAAAKAGLAKGDVLIGLHLWESLSPDHVSYVLNHKDLASFSPIKTYFIRAGKLCEALLTPDP